jgi:adenylosuccinate synthase
VWYRSSNPTGLVNPTCVGLIGSGVVIHVPSFFNELDALEQKGEEIHSDLICFSHDRCAGLNCSGRVFISDRAHLVFDFHQIVDGLKEVELGGSRYESSSCGFIRFLLTDVFQHRNHEERYRPGLLWESFPFGPPSASPF